MTFTNPTTFSPLELDIINGNPGFNTRINLDNANLHVVSRICTPMTYISR